MVLQTVAGLIYVTSNDNGETMNPKFSNTTFWLRILADAVLGALATKPMTTLMEHADAAPVDSRRSSLPPRIITGEVLRGAGVKKHLTPPQQRLATTISHYGYGAAMGMAYGLLLSPRPWQRGHLARGVGFGLGVYAISYLGWLPAMQSRASANRQPTQNNATMLLAHFVWGISLSAMDAWLSRRLLQHKKGHPVVTEQSDSTEHSSDDQ